MKRALLIAILGFVGCSLPFNLGPSAKTIYRLTPDLAPAAQYADSGKRLAVRDLLSSGYVNSHRILFSREAGRVGQYQYAVWEELPSKQITDLILLGIQQLGVFTSVSRTTSGSISDYQLNVEILDFTHEIPNGDSTIHAVFQAELIDLQTRKIVAQRLFAIDETVSRDDAQGAVEGFNRATGRFLRELGAWLAESIGASELPAE